MKGFTPLKDLESVNAILAKISFLGGVSAEQLGQIFRVLEVGHFAKGECVCERGEEPSHLYIITRGRIDLLVTDGESTTRKRDFSAGACFGEAAMLAMNNNTATFVAAEESELVVLSRRALSELRQQNPELFCLLMINLARELARKLQYTDEILLRYEREQGLRSP